MPVSKKIFYALAISIVFVLIHFLVDHAKPSDAVMAIVSIGGMIVTQVVAFLLLKRSSSALSFGGILGMLCLTQVLTVILLSLNSAYNPYADRKPLNFGEMGISLAIFGFVVPVIVTAILWFSSVKRRR